MTNHLRTLEGFNYFTVYQIDDTLNPYRVPIAIGSQTPHFMRGYSRLTPSGSSEKHFLFATQHTPMKYDDFMGQADYKST